jgi:hypothetical protein
MNLTASFTTLYMFILHPFLFFLCFKPTSPYCIEGGGGKSILMCSNKCSVNLKKFLNVVICKINIFYLIRLR